MSTLRFKVGDLAKIVRPLSPKDMGAVCEIRSVGDPYSDRDYVIFIAGDPSPFHDRLWGVYDYQLAPYPDPSEFDRDTEMWEDFKRLTGYQTPREVTCE